MLSLIITKKILIFLKICIKFLFFLNVVNNYEGLQILVELVVAFELIFSCLWVLIKNILAIYFFTYEKKYLKKQYVWKEYIKKQYVYM